MTLTALRILLHKYDNIIRYDKKLTHWGREGRDVTAAWRLGSIAWVSNNASQIDTDERTMVLIQFPLCLCACFS